jgi:hypothetical protein
MQIVHAGSISPNTGADLGHSVHGLGGKVVPRVV